MREIIPGVDIYNRTALTAAAASAGIITGVPWAAARQTICLLQMGPGQLGPSALCRNHRLPCQHWTGSTVCSDSLKKERKITVIICIMLYF